MAIAKDGVGNHRSAASDETVQSFRRSGNNVELIFCGNNNLSGRGEDDSPPDTTPAARPTGVSKPRRSAVNYVATPHPQWLGVPGGSMSTGS
jgi:hypothetical protein